MWPLWFQTPNVYIVQNTQRHAYTHTYSRPTHPGGVGMYPKPHAIGQPRQRPTPTLATRTAQPCPPRTTRRPARIGFVRLRVSKVPDTCDAQPTSANHACSVEPTVPHSPSGTNETPPCNTSEPRSLRPIRGLGLHATSGSVSDMWCTQSAGARREGRGRDSGERASDWWRVEVREGRGRDIGRYDGLRPGRRFLRVIYDK